MKTKHRTKLFAVLLTLALAASMAVTALPVMAKRPIA